jgi:stage II sporulation protein D
MYRCKKRSRPDRASLKRSRALVALTVLVSLLVPQQPTRAQTAKRLGAAVSPLRLVPTGDTPFQVGGLHAYYGSLEITAAADGLVLSNRLPLERYLLGLAEVPLNWPFEALKAQAVAARTYALYTLGRPPGGSAAIYGFDICASVDCQVYAGADIALGSGGKRWRAAVAETERQAILFDGEPILARYHSTSGGRTLDNPQAFPEEIGYPYLQGVTSTTEQGSPLYRWTTEFPLDRMQRLIETAGLWPRGNGKLRTVHSRPSSAGFHYPDLVFQGKRGRLVASAEEIRDVLRELAPQMFPGAYPAPAPTGSGRLPEVFPSNRMDVFTVRNTVRVIGRGWGHGVGMSQWGAHGLALRGASYADILTHYYTGVDIGLVDDPGPIEVGLDWARSSVQVSGEFDVIDGRGRKLVNGGLGTWRFDYAGEGAVAIDPPKGFGLPLEVGLVQAPETVGIGEPIYLTVALSRPAQVRTVTSPPADYEDPGAKITSAGRRRIVWYAPLEPGTFEVRVEARAGGTLRRTRPVVVEVRDAVPAPSEQAEPSDRDWGPPLWVVVVAGAGVALGFGVWAMARTKMSG